MAFLTGCGNHSTGSYESSAGVSSTVVSSVSEYSAANSENDVDYEPANSSQPSVIEPPDAEGYDILGGTWQVNGTVVKNQFVYLADNPALADLYDSVYLTFSSDGSFNFDNLYIHEGTYSLYKTANGELSFLLKCTSVYRLAYEDGEVVKKDSTDDSYPSYLVTIDSGNPNELTFSDFDPFLGKAKSDGSTYSMERYENTSNGGFSNTIPSSKQDETVRTPSNTPASAVPTPSTPASLTVTTGEKNALSKAKDYLDFTSFSYSGLIEQLEFEGFTHSEAVYGADNCGADWYEQAALKAADYLDFTSFSRSGLIEQLEFEGFTHEQAVYGAEQNGY